MKKADFRADFRHGQRSVVEPGPTPSPWSIAQPKHTHFYSGFVFKVLEWSSSDTHPLFRLDQHVFKLICIKFNTMRGHTNVTRRFSKNEITMCWRAYFSLVVNIRICLLVWVCAFANCGGCCKHSWPLLTPTFVFFLLLNTQPCPTLVPGVFCICI